MKPLSEVPMVTKPSVAQRVINCPVVPRCIPASCSQRQFIFKLVSIRFPTHPSLGYNICQNSDSYPFIVHAILWQNLVKSKEPLPEQVSKAHKHKILHTTSRDPQTPEPRAQILEGALLFSSNIFVLLPMEMPPQTQLLDVPMSDHPPMPCLCSMQGFCPEHLSSHFQPRKHLYGSLSYYLLNENNENILTHHPNSTPTPRRINYPFFLLHHTLQVLISEILQYLLLSCSYMPFSFYQTVSNLRARTETSLSFISSF